jgi:hypothetical protein
MRERKLSTGLVRVSDLANLDFLKHLRRQFPDDHVLPDDRDFEPLEFPVTDEHAKSQYRRAQARKVIRMYCEWKAAQN